MRQGRRQSKNRLKSTTCVHKRLPVVESVQRGEGEGVSEAFRSDQTPPFPIMLGQMFGQTDDHWRMGIVNQLLGGLGGDTGGLAAILN